MSKFLDRKEQVIEIELTAHRRNSFSSGKFVPKYYSFHDDDILYDNEYGPSGSIQNGHPKVSEEKQNDIVERVKTTPRVSIISNGGWLKNYKFFTASGEDAQINTNIASPRPDQISPATAKFVRTLGTSSPFINYMPAWEIKTMNGSEPLSVSGTENFPHRTGASGSEVIVPFFSSSLPLEYEVGQITINVDGNDVVIKDGGREVTRQMYELTNEGSLILDIGEINTLFKGNGNFDIEVFRAPLGEGNQLRDLKRLNFINDKFKDLLSMKLQEDPDEYTRVLAGDDEIIAKDIPKLDPSYVEYFLSVKVDNEIIGLEEEVKKARGETLYQGGASDPVDPCEDI